MMRTCTQPEPDLELRLGVARSLREQLARGVEDLPSPARLVLDLHVCREMSFDEIGRLLQITEERSRSLCTEALASLVWHCRPQGREVNHG